MKIVFLFAIFQSSTAICRHHYITMCNHFEDVEKYSNFDSWREVLIGKTDRALFRRRYASVNLGKFINKFTKLQVLMITEKINRLEKSVQETQRCRSGRIEFLNLYGNELKRIEKGDFPHIYITKLKLVNNRIAEIKKGAFSTHRIKVLDLSNNFLKYIEKGSLPGTSSTKILSIKNNLLMHIESGSCPPNLSTLNLDRNSLSNLTGVLDNLKFLEELTLSHNNFVVVPDLTQLTRLKILDLSFNDIIEVENTFFKQANSLQILNFGHNRLWDPNLLKHFLNETRRHILTVSVVFNRMTTVNLNESQHSEMVSFLSFGNPWNCSEWGTIGGKLSSYEETCSLRFYSTGLTPYCLTYASKSAVFSPSDLDEHVKRFYAAINRNKRLVGCSLGPKRVLYGCRTV